MDANTVFARTPKGAEEIDSRAHKLGYKARAILLAINGVTNAGELVRTYGRLGDVAQLLLELRGNGFIVEAGGAPRPVSVAKPTESWFDGVQREISAFVSEKLGPDGDLIAEKIEECGSPAAMKDFLEARREMLDLVFGKSRAPEFWALVARLLG